jgi:hypothetical protein
MYISDMIRRIINIILTIFSEDSMTLAYSEIYCNPLYHFRYSEGVAL